LVTETFLYDLEASEAALAAVPLKNREGKE
jgi:hypothetical protein